MNSPFRDYFLERRKLDYYNEIKNELVENEINKRVKDYSKNRSDLETYYKEL